MLEIFGLAKFHSSREVYVTSFRFECMSHDLAWVLTCGGGMQIMYEDYVFPRIVTWTMVLGMLHLQIICIFLKKKCYRFLSFP